MYVIAVHSNLLCRQTQQLLIMRKKINGWHSCCKHPVDFASFPKYSHSLTTATGVSTSTSPAQPRNHNSSQPYFCTYLSARYRSRSLWIIPTVVCVCFSLAPLVVCPHTASLTLTTSFHCICTPRKNCSHRREHLAAMATTAASGLR